MGATTAVGGVPMAGNPLDVDVPLLENPPITKAEGQREENATDNRLATIVSIVVVCVPALLFLVLSALALWALLRW